MTHWFLQGWVLDAEKKSDGVKNPSTTRKPSTREREDHDDDIWPNMDSLPNLALGVMDSTTLGSQVNVFWMNPMEQ